jgi:hypothetical protein
LSERSLTNLKGVHPDLIRVVVHALQTSTLDFTVIEGLRTLARQRELVKIGASRTLNSRHLHGFAVDLLPINPETGQGAFDWNLYHRLGPAVKRAAELEQVSVTWGGDWTTFKDGPHFELPHALYQDGMKFTALDPGTVQPRYVAPPAEPVPDVDARITALEARIAVLESKA